MGERYEQAFHRRDTNEWPIKYKRVFNLLIGKADQSSKPTIANPEAPYQNSLLGGM